MIPNVSQLLQLFDDGYGVIGDETPNVPELKPAVAGKVAVTIVRWNVAFVIPLVFCADSSHVAHVEGAVIRQVQVHLGCGIVARLSSKIGIDLENLAEVVQRLLAVGRPNLAPPHVDVILFTGPGSPLCGAAKQQLEVRVHGIRRV